MNLYMKMSSIMRNRRCRPHWSVYGVIYKSSIGLTYLNFSAFDDGCLQLFPGPIGVWAIGKSDETETFRSTLVKNNFNVQNRAKFLQGQNELFIS